eukprot:TRINITY_DN103671_c0_g1_i1.p1 TRINITY_DN103671_c0_g1~~TRINITY_DN103671_c0_g1_i1.p1  ORF type:complete len:482 (+),score=77.13 TRINITY_DN103671_c0_g1_i1:55-1500(+)
MGASNSCTNGLSCAYEELEVVESAVIDVQIFDEQGRLLCAERLDRRSDVGSLKMKIKQRTGTPATIQKLSQLLPMSEEPIVDLGCSLLHHPQVGSKPLMVRLLAQSGPFAMVTSWKEVELWDLRAEEGVHKLRLEKNFTVQCVAVGWEERRLMVAGAGLQIWDLDTGARAMSVGDQLFTEKHAGEICCIAIDWRSKRAFTGTTKGSIHKWDLSVDEAPEQVTWRHTRRVLCLDVDWAAQRVLSAGQDSVLKTVDISSRDGLERSLEGHNGWVQCVSAAWNHIHSTLPAPVHRGLSGSTDLTLKLWDLEEHKELLTLQGHDSMVQCLTVSWEAYVALSGDLNGSLRYWDLNSGLCLRDFRTSSSISTLTVDFARNRALTGSPDRRLRLWNTEKGVCLRELPRFANGITRVAMDWAGSFLLGTSKGPDWDALDRDIAENAQPEACPMREWTQRGSWDGLAEEEEDPTALSENTILLTRSNDGL